MQLVRSHRYNAQTYFYSSSYWIKWRIQLTGVLRLDFIIQSIGFYFYFFFKKYFHFKEYLFISFSYILMKIGLFLNVLSVKFRIVQKA